jgi:hypothetical protein
MTDKNIVKPVQLAKEIGVAPQLVFSWIRSEKLNAHECVCGHKYLLRDEVDPFLKEREAKKAEKDAKIEAELEAEETDAQVA